MSGLKFQLLLSQSERPMEVAIRKSDWSGLGEYGNNEVFSLSLSRPLPVENTDSSIVKISSRVSVFMKGSTSFKALDYIDSIKSRHKLQRLIELFEILQDEVMLSCKMFKQ
jgi:hypothetical protein